MSLFRDADIEDLDNKIEDIVKNADVERYKKVKPTLDQMWDIIFTVRDFVIEKKRKVYGGFALHKLIDSVDPEVKIYDDDNIESWDIDFYSPDPIGDGKEIANRLHDKGYRFVMVGEALHDETYKVFAETMDCADISYVPRNIYNRIPFKQINGLHLTGAHFLMIDYFRVITDPLTSYHRLEKMVTRLNLMDKYFSLPHNSSSLDIVPAEDELDIAFRTVHEFFTDRESTIVLGTYAYDHMVKESGIQDRTTKAKQARPRDNNKPKKETQIKMIPVNYYEAISMSYKKDSRALILKLREKFLDDGKLIIYEESYPFFQYIGYSVAIYYEEDVICKLYHYNNRCTPYHVVKPYYFGDRTAEFLDKSAEKSKIQIGSYPLLMMYNLITIMKARADNDNHTKNMYYTLNSHLIEMKNWYLDTNDKTIYDDTLFKDFILECKGEMVSQHMEKQLRIERKKEAGKKYTFRYNPDNAGDRNNKSAYRFKNSSGNAIRNDRNMQIDLTADEMNIKDDIESDMESENEDDGGEEIVARPKTDDSETNSESTA
jgi:Mimiviridae putative poly(A) polymerase catalytic subunit